ncbi:hypothetical protein STEG23_002440 [Scotinomys teguina]
MEFHPKTESRAIIGSSYTTSRTVPEGSKSACYREACMCMLLQRYSQKPGYRIGQGVHSKGTGTQPNTDAIFGTTVQVQCEDHERRSACPSLVIPGRISPSVYRCVMGKLEVIMQPFSDHRRYQVKKSAEQLLQVLF